MWSREDEDAYEEFLNTPDPSDTPKSPKNPEKGWSPRLNPTQQLIFDDPSDFILGFGEKFSGKGIAFLHKAVRHAYENSNSLVLLIAPAVRTGNEGIWYDLESLVLPAWRDGNVHPKTGEQLDSGIGLDYTTSKRDPNTKDCILWIGNRFGGWSKVMLISIPYASMVEARIKGPAPSFVYIDELTNCDGPEYFSFISAQLKRRRHITGPMQYTASCNPKGPSHWVYNRFWTLTQCEPNDPKGKLCHDGVWRNAKYSVYHVKLEENAHNVQDGYVEHIMESFAGDEIQLARLKDGLWVDMPTGQAMFKGYFVPGAHVQGNLRESRGLVPRAGFPIDIGYDPGPQNFSLTFEQTIPTKERTITIVFDELNYVGKDMPYHAIVPELISRMVYWNKKAGDGVDFWYEHIADEAAFNQKNRDGSFDNQHIERLVREYLRDNPHITIKPFRLKPCPKGNDSVPIRMQTLMNLWRLNSLYISALCTKTIEACNRLECEQEKQGKYDALLRYRPKRSIFIHPVDSMSYPIFYRTTTGLSSIRTDKVAPRVFVAGTQ